jgi:hypothetical protein
VDTPAASLEAERMLRVHGDDLSGLGWLPSAGWLGEVASVDGAGSFAQGVWQRVASSWRRRQLPLPSDAE